MKEVTTESAWTYRIPAGVRVLFSPPKIDARQVELARQISRDYAGQELFLVCILKGSMHFFSDLARQLTLPVRYGYLGVSSYKGGADSSGTVEFTTDLQDSIEGRHVLLVDDIVDTGRTLRRVVERLRERGPASIKLATLLDKPSRRVVDVAIDYRGFTIPDEFVIGYGLDYGELYRNLPFIGVLENPAEAQASLRNLCGLPTGHRE